jgi:hypothetical protein
MGMAFLICALKILEITGTKEWKNIIINIKNFLII